MANAEPKDDQAFTKEVQENVHQESAPQDNASVQGDENRFESIDQEKLQSVLDLKIKPWDMKYDSQSEDRSSGKSPELIEEIAEDMLHVLERLKDFETKQTALLETMNQLQQAIYESKRNHTIELDKLRRELLEERKALTARSSFNAIVPVLDALRAMRNGFDPEKDAQIFAQVSAVCSTLTNILQGLGFIEFLSTQGESFDPSRMECLGYKNGALEGVIEVVRPGYQIQDMVIRPCGILLAKPFESDHNNMKGEEEL